MLVLMVNRELQEAPRDNISWSIPDGQTAAFRLQCDATARNESARSALVSYLASETALKRSIESIGLAVAVECGGVIEIGSIASSAV